MCKFEPKHKHLGIICYERAVELIFLDWFKLTTLQNTPDFKLLLLMEKIYIYQY